MYLKKYFPRRIFVRFTLIIVLPVIIIQLISAYIFYQTHLKKVVNRISNGTLQKIAILNKNFNEKTNYTDIDIEMTFVKGKTLKKIDIIKKSDRYAFFEQEQFFISNLFNLIDEKFGVKDMNNFYLISIQKNNGVLEFLVSKKELTVKTDKIFIIWNIALSTITLIIALIFMKNQLKPIKILKKQIQNFSINQKIVSLKPSGAKEIRDLTISFLEMERKIKRFIDQRTMMLAGISHDLRTPLTRMKLELEFLESDVSNYLKEDIKYMENIVNQYLDFSKNIDKEEKGIVPIYDYLNSFIKEYKKIHHNLTFKIENIDKKEMVLIQKNAFKRVFQNILDNSYKFSTKAIVRLSKNNNKIEINFDDNGDGVMEEELEKISEPFYKSKKSKNINEGVGLGLSIVKDIVFANNANIEFNNSKILSGFNVKITINQSFNI